MYNLRESYTLWHHLHITHTHLWHDNKFSSLSINSLDQSSHCDITNGNTPDVAHAVNSSYLLIGNREEDIGLRLRASLRCDL